MSDAHLVTYAKVPLIALAPNTTTGAPAEKETVETAEGLPF